MGRPQGPYFVRVLGGRLEQEVHMRKSTAACKLLLIYCSRESFGSVKQVLGNRRTWAGHKRQTPIGMSGTLTTFCARESFGIVKQGLGNRRTSGHKGLTL